MTELDTKNLPSKLEIREKVLSFEKEFSKVPGVTFGDSASCPLKHSFAPGMCVREIFIPKNTLIVGKIHKHAHPNFLMKGKVLVVTEGGGRECLEAPRSMISSPGTKRVLYTLEDTVWIVVHATNETDIVKIENEVIAKSYEEYDKLGDDMVELIEETVVENATEKNCLVLALKEKGRNFEPLLKLERKGYLLPFNKAMDTLIENNVSVEGLYAEKINGIWHVSDEGTPLEGLRVTNEDYVGVWVAVALAVGGAVYSGVSASKNAKEAKKNAASLRGMNKDLSYKTDPWVNKTQEDLYKQGTDILNGNLNDYYRPIGEIGGQEFEGVLGMGKRDIEQNVLEGSAMTGSRGGASASAIAKATGDYSANMRFADWARAIQGREGLLTTGLNTIGGVRSAGLQREGWLNQFEMNKAGLNFDITKTAYGMEQDAAAKQTQAISSGISSIGTAYGYGKMLSTQQPTTTTNYDIGNVGYDPQTFSDATNMRKSSNYDYVNGYGLGTSTIGR